MDELFIVLFASITATQCIDDAAAMLCNVRDIEHKELLLFHMNSVCNPFDSITAQIMFVLVSVNAGALERYI